MEAIKRYGPAIIWSIAIAIATLMPSSSFPKAPNWGFSIDKVIHLLLFGILTILVLKGHLPKNQTPAIKILALVVTFCILFGLLLETGQIYAPGRNFSWPDVAANSFGSTVGAWAFRAYVKFRS